LIQQNDLLIMKDRRDPGPHAPCQRRKGVAQSMATTCRRVNGLKPRIHHKGSAAEHTSSVRLPDKGHQSHYDEDLGLCLQRLAAGSGNTYFGPACHNDEDKDISTDGTVHVQ